MKDGGVPLLATERHEGWRGATVDKRHEGLRGATVGNREA